MVLVGCGSGSNGAPRHTADEEKALESVKNLTPEQQIERAQASPLPPEQKEGLIKSIKEKHGIK